MALEGYATFFIGSILVCLSMAVIGILLVFLNYIFVKYWKPVNFGYWSPRWMERQGARFMTEEEFAEYQRHLAVRDREEPPKLEPKLDK